MMNSFLYSPFLDNNVLSWLVAAGIILLTLFFSRIISKWLAILFVKIFTKVERQDYSVSFSQRIVQPLSRYVFWLVTIITLSKLHFPRILNFDIFKLSDKALLDSLSAGWLVICFFRLIIGIVLFIGEVLKNKAVRKNDRAALQLISLLADLTRALLIVICVLIILKISFHYSLSSFVTSLGLVTAALALAAKESVENIICSFIIFMDKPFYVGDYIRVNGVSGAVEKIGLRSTLLRTDNKTLISMSNHSVIGDTLENVSRQRLQRFFQTLELSLDTPSGSIVKFVDGLRSILQQKKDIQNITASFKTTGQNSHKVYMEYFVPMQLVYADFLALNQQVNIEILELLQSLNISLVKYTANV